MDKKLKKAADKIKMPEDMKERIIRNCESLEKNNIIRKDNDDGYTEVASGIERVESGRNIIRTISAIAACAVLAAGIGTTGFLLHRQKNNGFADSGVEMTTVTTEPAAYKISPFGDFRKFDYTFNAGIAFYGKYGPGSIYNRFADFFNNFDWGEDTKEIKDPIVLNDYDFSISWDVNNIVSWIFIAKDGYVIYTEDKYDDNFDKIIESNKRSYRIDFDAFLNGYNEIVSIEEHITQSDVDSIINGEMTSVELLDQDNNMLYSSKNGEGKEKLGEFLKNDFVPMLLVNMPVIDYDSNYLKYNIEYEFRENDHETRRLLFSILENGVVGYSTYTDDEPTGVGSYYIDLDEFGSKLEELGAESYITGTENNTNLNEELRVREETNQKIKECKNCMESLAVWLKADRAGFSVSTFNGENKRVLYSDDKEKLLSYIESHDFGERDTKTVIPGVPDDFREIDDDGPFGFALNIFSDDIVFGDGRFAFTRDMRYAVYYYGGVAKYVEVVELPDAEQLNFLYDMD